MSRRRQPAAPMSLFSFQDIITATTGILILLALVLALSLITQGAESAIETPFADADRLAYRLALTAEIESMHNRSTQIADQTASLISMTPEDLKRKSSQAAESIQQLKLSVANARTQLQEMQTQKKDLQQQADQAALQAKLEKLNEEIEQTNLKLTEIIAANRVVYNFRNTNRSAWLVQVKQDTILAAKAGVSEKPQVFRNPAEFNRFAVSLPQAEQYFVILIAPSGIASSEQIRLFLAGRDIEIGIDLVAEDQFVIDPQLGAGF